MLPRADPNGVLTMYAVIATGGKQYRVEKDGVLRIEKLEAEPGSTVSFDQVLMVADGDKVTLGKPLLSGLSVLAPTADMAKLLVWSFIAGFSERLVPDTIDRTEARSRPEAKT